MKRLTDEELTAIRERAEKASTSPWITEEGEFSGENWLIAYTGADVDGKEYYITTDRVYASALEGNPKDDAEFIAHAREDIPKLIMEIEALRTENQRYRKALEEIRNYGTFELNNALKTDYGWIAHEALEGEE